MNDTTLHFVADLIVGGARPSAQHVWWELEDVLVRYRLAGLAHSVVAGWDSVPGDMKDRLEAAHRTQAVGALLLAEEWEAVRSALAAEGIAASLVKGGWMNALAYYRAGERALDDIDVVVPPRAAPDATRILERSGWLPWESEPSRTIAWAGAATFQPRGAARLAGLAIDLHGSLNYGALRAFPEPGDEGRPWSVGWTPEAQLVLTVEHFLKHLRCRTHLVGLVDVARLLRGGLDLEEAAARLHRGPWGVTGVALVQAVSARIGGEVAARWESTGVARTARPFNLVDLVANAASRPGRLSGVVSRWLLRGFGAAARECGDVLFPPEAWLRRRYGSPKALMPARLEHLTRMMGWAVGAAPSPLSPNQE